MGTLYPVKQDADQVVPQATVTLLAEESPVMLDCAFWPLKNSEFNWVAQVPLATMLSDFIEDSIIPDGTVTLAQRKLALEGLARVQATLDQAVSALKAIPLRPSEVSTSAMTEEGVPVTTKNLAPQRGFDLAQDIDALYVADPLSAGSLERRAQVQLRLQEAFAAMDKEQARAAAIKASPSRKIWNNGCATKVPEALRFLAEHDRPQGGQQSFNSEHLYQLADEIEAAVTATVKLGFHGNGI